MIRYQPLQKILIKTIINRLWISSISLLQRKVFWTYLVFAQNNQVLFITCELHLPNFIRAYVQNSVWFHLVFAISHWYLKHTVLFKILRVFCKKFRFFLLGWVIQGPQLLQSKRASVINVTILGFALIVTNEPWSQKWRHLFNLVLVAVTPGQFPI